VPAEEIFMARARLHKRYKKRNPDAGSGGSSSAKPPGLVEVAELAIPGVAGFALSRFVTRVAAVQVAKRAPTLGKHAGGVAAVGTLIAAWLLANKSRWLSQYQLPIVVGAAIAAVQSLLQLYFPTIGWVVSDASAAIDDVATGNAQQQTVTSNGQVRVTAGRGPSGALPSNLSETDEDPNVYEYDDRYESKPQQQPGQPAQPQQQGGGTEDDLIAELEAEAQQTQGLGVFS
jgi:hypothetical protein